MFHLKRSPGFISTFSTIFDWLLKIAPHCPINSGGCIGITRQWKQRTSEGAQKAHTDMGGKAVKMMSKIEHILGKFDSDSSDED